METETETESESERETLKGIFILEILLKNNFPKIHIISFFLYEIHIITHKVGRVKKTSKYLVGKSKLFLNDFFFKKKKLITRKGFG